MTLHDLECPNCGHKFTIKEDYDSGVCPHCKNAFYYWDYVLDEETFEELLSGYYWKIGNN